MTTQDWVPVVVTGPDQVGPSGPTGPRGPSGGETGPKGDPAKAYVGDVPPPPESSYVLWVDTSGDGESTELGNMIIKGVGNLLTANQATGGDELDSTDGFGKYGTAVGATIAYDTTQKFTGDGSIKYHSPNAVETSNGIQLYPSSTYYISALEHETVTIEGHVYTEVARSLQLYVTQWTAAGVWMSSQSAVKTIPANTWTKVQHTVRLAAGTGLISGGFISSSPAWAAGESMWVDRPGLWRGAGGQWALPGSPITNTGIKVEANTLYVWDGSAWRNAGAVT